MALPHVGKSLAEKIAEIAQSGGLQKLEMLQSSDSLQSVQLFMRIWGVGAETANQWANQVSPHQVLYLISDLEVICAGGILYVLFALIKLNSLKNLSGNYFVGG